MRWFVLLALLLACRVVHAEDYRPTYEQDKALCAKGKYQEALPLAEQALRLSRKEFGEAHENTGVLLANLGLIYERLGDYEKAPQLLTCPPLNDTTFESSLSAWPRTSESSNATRQAIDGGADYSGTSGG